jgi:hypothetical protein
MERLGGRGRAGLNWVRGSRTRRVLMRERRESKSSRRRNWRAPSRSGRSDRWENRAENSNREQISMVARQVRRLTVLPMAVHQTPFTIAGRIRMMVSARIRVRLDQQMHRHRV